MHDQATHDLRHYQRIKLRTEASINDGNNNYSCDLIDLALQGALFRSSDDVTLEVGDKCHIIIRFPETELSMEFTGELIHRNDNFIGFIFNETDDETLTHLRRMLALNFGDGDQAEQEFSHWINRGDT